MTETVRGTYDDSAQAQNVKDDLLATGIPRDKIFVDEDAKQIKVMIPATTKPEIIDILNRHNLTQVA